MLEVLTDQPGVQLYTGNHLGGAPSAGGFKQHEGFCLETQHYPDSPNKPDFPTTLLKPGEKYSETTKHKFSVSK
jgi:aldose 1-epimerase